ncbi:hypothetical protein SK128_009128 [Halocaridina rubra]|uniref:Uncharacterized protein n=1 Tax=Halocaridina rubra TaxID=373956 RepID=A0AAN8WDY4_HALRR
MKNEHTRGIPRSFTLLYSNSKDLLLFHRSGLTVGEGAGGGGGITFPLFSGGHSKNMWTTQPASASNQVISVLSPPNQIKDPSAVVFSDSFSPIAYKDLNISQTDFKKHDKILAGEFDPKTYSRLPSYAPAPKDSRNQTSRFFTLNTGRQTLDLGISFTVPFLSFPMTSLATIGQDLGESTATALNSLMAINWPSVILIGVAILGAALLLPQVGTWVMTLLNGNAGTSSYTSSYGRVVDRADQLLPVAPFTAILEQIDDALAQYDLDSTSCMQRAVCSYVSDSEDSVRDGDPDSAEMIVAGLARNHWMQSLLGQGSLAKAVELGRTNGHCQRQFSKCPFSLGGVFKFLTAYAELTS